MDTQIHNATFSLFVFKITQRPKHGGTVVTRKNNHGSFAQTSLGKPTTQTIGVLSDNIKNAGIFIQKLTSLLLGLGGIIDKQIGNTRTGSDCVGKRIPARDHEKPTEPSNIEKTG